MMDLTLLKAELVRDLTSREHFQDLGEVVRDTYEKERIRNGSSIVFAAFKAGLKGILYDAEVTKLRGLRIYMDLVGYSPKGK